MSRRIAFVVVLLSALTSTLAMAQDANYWTNKYGTRSILLNGAVIGGPVDLSTMYYNPGGLALMPDPGVVLTVKAFEFANIKLPDAGGKGIDLDDPRSSVLPTFVGGLVSLKFLGSDRLAYSLFPRQGLRANITGVSQGQVEALPSPGMEDYFVEVGLERDLDETWVGATWSKKIGDRIGVGVGPYLAVRNQRTRNHVLGQTVGSDGETAMTMSQQAFRYDHYRLLAKLGASMRLEKLELGLTVTTPGLKVKGSGEAGIDRLRVGLDVDGDGQPDNRYAVSLERDLESTWKSPLSIGAGATMFLGSTKLYLSGEWFAEVGPFDVLTVTPVTDLVTGDTIPFEIVQHAKSITNGAIGLEQPFGPRFTGYLSFATDFSTATDEYPDTAISNWDIYVVTAGTTFSVGQSEFTAGFGYAFGDHQTRLPASLAEDTASSDIGAPPTLGKARYSSIRLIFGFSI